MMFALQNLKSSKNPMHWQFNSAQCNQTATVQAIKFVKDVDFSNFSLPLAKTAGWVLLNEQLYYPDNDLTAASPSLSSKMATRG
jgi:hypothetical protein